MAAVEPLTVPTLDAAALAELRRYDPDGSLGIVARILEAYRASLDRGLPKLERQLVERDPGVVADLAHHFKASSLSVGAVGFAAACRDVDRRIRSGAAGDLDAELARLLAEARAARRAVEARLQG